MGGEVSNGNNVRGGGKDGVADTGMVIVLAAIGGLLVGAVLTIGLIVLMRKRTGWKKDGAIMEEGGNMHNGHSTLHLTTGGTMSGNSGGQAVEGTIIGTVSPDAVYL